MSKPTNVLLGLPACPACFDKCSKCGRADTEPGMGWISRDWGCKVCSPEDEERMLAASATGSRPS